MQIVSQATYKAVLIDSNAVLFHINLLIPQ